MTNPLTASELAQLSTQVEEQLRELNSASVLTRASFSEPKSPPTDLPPKQRQAIEQHSDESAEHFLHKLSNQAKDILCSADSDLQKEYEIFGNLKKDELLEKLAGLLAVMGFSTGALQMLSVAVAVYILHIGLKTFSRKYCK